MTEMTKPKLLGGGSSRDAQEMGAEVYVIDSLQVEGPMSINDSILVLTPTNGRDSA